MNPGFSAALVVWTVLLNGFLRDSDIAASTRIIVIGVLAALAAFGAAHASKGRPGPFVSPARFAVIIGLLAATVVFVTTLVPD